MSRFSAEHTGPRGFHQAEMSGLSLEICKQHSTENTIALLTIFP